MMGPDETTFFEFLYLLLQIFDRVVLKKIIYEIFQLVFLVPIVVKHTPIK